MLKYPSFQNLCEGPDKIQMHQNSLQKTLIERKTQICMNYKILKIIEK